VRILVVTNLYPPHLADTDDFRCQNVTEALGGRGHELRVLTSTCGLASEAGHTARALGDSRDALVQRRLRVNGEFGQFTVASLGDLRELEARNNAVLRDALAEFQPDVVHVWSLRGLSKSLLVTLRRTGVPACFDMADPWLAEELATDPWLAWWHRERVPAMQKVQRTGLEVSGQRAKWDAATPTFLEPGVNRLPAIFDRDTHGGAAPNSLGTPQLRRTAGRHGRGGLPRRARRGDPSRRGHAAVQRRGEAGDRAGAEVPRRRAAHPALRHGHGH
jgi:hypothetical protein